MSKKEVNKRAEEAAFDYQRDLGMVDSVSDEHVAARRVGFYDGYIKGYKETMKNVLQILNTLKVSSEDIAKEAPYSELLGGAIRGIDGCITILKIDME